MAVWRAVMRLLWLEGFEIAVELPLRHVEAEFVPFGALGVDEVAVDVLAEGFPDDGVALQLVDRLAQRPGHLADPHLRDACGVDLEQALLDRRAQLEPAFHAVEAG